MDAGQPEVKKRRQNFSEREVRTLVLEVEVNIAVIQSKLSSSISIARKNQVWQRIADRINSSNAGCVRSKEEIKRKWHDMVSAVRKKESARQRQMKGTGGGGPPVQLNEIEEKILSLIPHVIVEGISGGIESKVPGINPEHVEMPQIMEAVEAPTTHGMGDTTIQAATPSTSTAQISEAPLMLHADDQILEANQFEDSNNAGGYMNSMKRRGPNNHHTETRRASVDFQEDFLSIEKQKLQIEFEKLQLMRRCAAAQEKLVEIEDEKLKILKQMYGNDPYSVGTILSVSPNIKFLSE